MPEFTSKAVAVAVVAVSKYIAGSDPNYRPHLEQSLRNAELAGLDDQNLALLRFLVETSAAPGGNPDPSSGPD